MHHKTSLLGLFVLMGLGCISKPFTKSTIGRLGEWQGNYAATRPVIPESVILSNRCHLLKLNNGYAIHDYVYGTVYIVDSESKVKRIVKGGSFSDFAIYKSIKNDSTGYHDRKTIHKNALRQIKKYEPFIEGVTARNNKLYYQLTYLIPESMKIEHEDVIGLMPYAVCAVEDEKQSYKFYSLDILSKPYLTSTAAILPASKPNEWIIPVTRDVAKKAGTEVYYTAGQFELSNGRFKLIRNILPMPGIYKSKKVYYNFSIPVVSYPWAALPLDNKVVNLTTRREFKLPFNNDKLLFKPDENDSDGMYIPYTIIGLSTTANRIRLLVRQSSEDKRAESLSLYVYSKDLKLESVRKLDINQKKLISDFSTNSTGEFIALNDKYEIISI